jgi:hypothetical protein
VAEAAAIGPGATLERAETLPEQRDAVKDYFPSFPPIPRRTVEARPKKPL